MWLTERWAVEQQVSARSRALERYSLASAPLEASRAESRNEDSDGPSALESTVPEPPSPSVCPASPVGPSSGESVPDPASIGVYGIQQIVSESHWKASVMFEEHPSDDERQVPSSCAQRTSLSFGGPLSGGV